MKDRRRKCSLISFKKLPKIFIYGLLEARICSLSFRAWALIRFSGELRASTLECIPWSSLSWVPGMCHFSFTQETHGWKYLKGVIKMMPIFVTVFLMKIHEDITLCFITRNGCEDWWKWSAAHNVKFSVVRKFRAALSTHLLPKCLGLHNVHFMLLDAGVWETNKYHSFPPAWVLFFFFSGF